MSKFLSYIHNLRGAAIFFVVGVHARGNILDWDHHNGEHNFLRVLFDSREGNGTVMFLFIGGFLFQYLTRQSFEFKRYLEQKIKFVILPYILISIPIIAFRIYTGYNHHAFPEGFNDQSAFYRFFYYLITRLHMAPFWFISAIMLFYISAPLFHALDKPKIYRWVLPPLALSCLFTYRSLHNANPLLSYLHYFPIYFMGMWAAHFRERILKAGDYLLYPLLAVYVGIAIAEFNYWIPSRPAVTFESVLQNGLLIFNLYMFKAILLCFILLFILYKLRTRKIPLLEILGEYSFGVFFVHCIYIFVSRRILYNLFGPLEFSLLSFTIYFTFVLFASIATVYFIKRLTGRYSRILIGS